MNPIDIREARWDRIDAKIFENLPHGDTLTKFIAVDNGTDDFTVEIHGFVKCDGSLIITHEYVNPKKEGTT